MSAPYPFPYKSVACTFLLLWVFVFLSADLFAGSFRTLGIKVGLGSRQVFQINKDSAGFVWVYTHVGIDRYDGNEIKHYKLDGMVDSRDNIQSSTTMMCDKEGIVWVALKNGKIYAYNKLTDSFNCVWTWPITCLLRYCIICCLMTKTVCGCVCRRGFILGKKVQDCLLPD